MMRIFFTLLITLLFSSSIDAKALECIAANDFGLGGYSYIKANPNEDSSGQVLLKSDLTKEPKSYQIAAWVETNLYTTGVSAVGANGSIKQRAVLKMYVDGRWYPFGRIKPGEALAVSDEDKGNVNNKTTNARSNDCARDTQLERCDFDPCTPKEDPDANDSLCLEGDGKTLDMGGRERKDTPCCVDHGRGLYGLIAIERNGESANPNDSKHPEISRYPPTSDFRTFHIWPLQQDENGKYFELDLTKQCYVDASNTTVCLQDANQDGNGVVTRGKLYFKINDNYYNDNTGYYSINVVSGVYKKRGFVEKTIETFETQTRLVSAGMFQLIARDTKFISIVQALLLLYMTVFGLMFSMGMVQISQSDLVVRLLKLGIMATLISESSFDFFNTYLFSLFTGMGTEISSIIYESTLFYSDAENSPKFILPEDASPLSVYDVMIDMLISRSLHMKIMGLVFTKYIWYIPFIYARFISSSGVCS